MLDNGGNLIRMTFGNGAYVKYSYDLLDRPIKEVYYTSSNTITKQIRYVYNAQGALGKQYTLNSSGTVTEKIQRSGTRCFCKQNNRSN